MRTHTRVAVILLTLFGCVGCDQVTKSIARERLPAGETISLLRDTVRLEFAQNPGAFLSLGSAFSPAARRALFTFGAAALVAAAMLWTFRSRRMGLLPTVGAAMICRGGLGNLIDRVTR